LNILLYSRVFPPSVGGMERFAATLAAELAGQGHELVVATRTPTPIDTDRSLPYRVLRRPEPSALFRAARRADAVHVNGASANGIALAVSAGRRPLVTHQAHQAVCPTGLAWSEKGECIAGPRAGPCPSCPGKGVLGKARVAIHRAGDRAALENVCVSGYLKERLQLPKSETVYNPVSNSAYASVSAGLGESELVAFAGRLVAEKGLHLLLRALALLPSVRLEVAGDGPLKGSLDALVRQLDLGSRVRFLGALPFEGVAELYSRAALVCVPSLWGEPFGYAAAEAMAMERPVVATPRGSLIELLGAGRGFVATGMDPHDLATTILQALEDDGSRTANASRARAFAEAELTDGTIGGRYLDLYQLVARE
jgi:glycosyltransferase involved in cell wall biosynthesis